ncbi:mCG1037650, partial [Mus musculus]
ISVCQALPGPPAAPRKNSAIPLAKQKRALARFKKPNTGLSDFWRMPCRKS